MTKTISLRSSGTKRELFYAGADIVAKVNEVLAAKKKHLWQVSDMDSLKLRRLLVWSERYSVSLAYILDTILPVLSRAIERRTGKRSKGLGVSIPVLTGDVAKSILLERITKDFPSGENVTDEFERRRNEILFILDSESNGRPKPPLFYKTSRDYSQAYLKTIHRKKREREKLEEKVAAMPYRRNPFR